MRIEAAAIAVLLLAALAAPVTAQVTPPRITIEQGVVEGALDREVPRFLGIPYAAAPTGERRWAPAAPAPSWGSQPLRAIRFGPACPQELTPDGVMMWTSEYMTPVAPGVSEDCLSLNIWLPPDTRPGAAHGQPVLFFIHGGAFASGSSSVPLYDGAALARQGVVVVTINYRLGTLGFMAHRELSGRQGGVSGNYGLGDQIAALNWVARNIGSFGGDPGRVTLAGQSAGAWSVLALLAAPQAKGLFQQAVVLSALGMPLYTGLEEAQRRGDRLLTQWHAPDIAAARALPAASLPTLPMEEALTRDGRIVPSDPDSPIVQVPILAGYTANDLLVPECKPVSPAEWAAQAVRRFGKRAAAFLKAYPGANATLSTLSTCRDAGDRAQLDPLFAGLSGRTIYAYRFGHVGPGSHARTYGAFHSAELPYMFGTLRDAPDEALRPSDHAVAKAFSGAIVRFVKTGDPNGANLPRWRPATPADRVVMQFNDGVSVARSPASP